MDEVIIETIKWTAPEYDHKNRSVDWFWAVGLVTIVAIGLALWQHNYLFSVFLLVSGVCIMLFNFRAPHDIEFIIQTDGFSINNDKHSWKNIKGFNIKSGEPYSKLLIETSKKFIPIYTILIPNDLISTTKENLEKIIPNIELNESQSIQFIEKIGL